MESSKVLIRGLKVLEHLLSVGTATGEEVSVALGYSKQASYRFLSALEAAGFARREGCGAPFEATTKAATIVAKTPIEPRVANIARPILAKLTRATGWPLMLVTLDGPSLVVIAATQGYLEKRQMISRTARIPFFRHPGGTICYSYLDSARRVQVLKDCLATFDKRPPHSADMSWWHDFALTTRSRGSLFYEALTQIEAGIAVPVIVSPKRVYALQMRTFPKRVKLRRTHGEILAELKVAASAISRLLREAGLR